MIKINNLTKFYGKVKAVDSVSFEVKQGEILGLLGPNGAGKTTIMRILTGFLHPTSGDIYVDKYNYKNDLPKIKEIIGYMPETPMLYNDMRVKSYLKFICDIRGMAKNEKNDRIQKVLEELNLVDVKDTMIGKLSKGYRQRVGLAGSLVHDPKILILDEPTVGLDPKQIIEIRDLIRSFTNNKTVILSSHILPEVSQICGRIVIIDEGHIVAIDTQEELLARTSEANKLVIEVKGDGKKIIEKTRRIKGVRSVFNEKENNGNTSFIVECETKTDIRDELFKLIVSEKGVIYELRPLSVSLEDVFLKLTTREKEEKQI